MNLVTPDTRLRLRSHHPEAIQEIENLERVLDETALDPALLSLCSDFFNATLRSQGWSVPASAGELETACLELCEQFSTSVSDVRDDQVAALRAHLGTDDVYNLMYAIYLIEMSQRLDITLERALS